MRKGARKISTLLIVLGLLCLVIGLVIAASGLTQIENQQDRFFRAGLLYALVGVVLFMARFVFFRLPEIREARRSETARRRRQNSMNFRRPKPSQDDTDDVPDSQQGSVLIFVLIVLGIISVLSIRSIVVARATHQHVDARLQQEMLKLAAIDSLRDAMQRLADDPDLTVDHPGEDWTRRIEITDPSGIQRIVHIADAQRVFDLNNLAIPDSRTDLSPVDILGNIMVMAGIMRPGLQIEALRDAMDEDAEGAFENTRYENDDLPNRIPDRALYSLHELFGVEGWTSDLFNRSLVKTPGNPFNLDLVDCVGVIPAPRERIIPVNIYSAGAPALKALFGPGREGVVERMLFVRDGPVRRNLDFLADLLGDEVFVRIAPYLTVSSSWFEIHSAASNRDGRSVQLVALAYRDEQGRVSVIKATFG